MNMAELIVALLGAGAALVVWRALKARATSSMDAVAVSGFGAIAQRPVPDLHHWPRLGRFDFEIAETSHPQHQSALHHAQEQEGSFCMAHLVPRGRGDDPGAPVEVQVAGVRVGFLSMGDATRFHHRLAYESHPGRVSQCGAHIVCADPLRGGKHLTILLDLKPFRH